MTRSANPAGQPSRGDSRQDNSVLGSLRRATDGRHQALEALSTLSLPLQRDRYIQALQGFEVLLAVWEPLVLRALPIRLHEWLASRSRYAFARSDLEQLGCGPIVDADLRERCAAHVRFIDLASVATAFGSMYVLEGSRLGGQVIARAVRDAPDIGARNATYFAGSGSATGLGWRDFLARMEAEISDDAESHAAASNSARQTFDALIEIFMALRDAPATR